MDSGKMTFEEYLSSPERQREMKIAKETADRKAFEIQLEWKRAQAENPIMGRPRKKRKKK